MSDFDNDFDNDFDLDDELFEKKDKPLNLRKCDEKESATKIKGKLQREILPELELMEHSNSKITNDLETMLYSALNESELDNASEETLQHLSELLIYHAIIDEHLDEIRSTTKEI
jgi:hypothetical protein